MGTRIQLTEDEIWLLRFLDENCGKPNCEAWVNFPAVAWSDPQQYTPLLSEVVERFTYDRLNMTIEELAQLGLVDFNQASNGLFARISARGRQHVRQLDNPDIIEKISEWARRKPMIAYTILGTMLLVWARGLVSIVIELVEVANQVAGAVRETSAPEP